MAIFGFGTHFGDRDVSQSFIKNGIVGTGWGCLDAPDVYQFIGSLKVGDIVFLKSASSGSDITVKAVGIISDENIIPDENTSYDPPLELGLGRNVRWVSTRTFTIPKPDGKNNVRANTMYEEFHPDVRAQILGEFPKAT